jgi:hypothetical protein
METLKRLLKEWPTPVMYIVMAFFIFYLICVALAFLFVVCWLAGLALQI